MANVNQLTINASTYEINDIRITTGTGTPSGGSNGDIYFRKDGDNTVGSGWSVTLHPDGTAECWKRYNLGSVSYGGWGSYYSKDNVASGLDYPITFSEMPTVIVTVGGGYGPWTMTYAGAGGTTTKAPACGLVCHSSSSTNTYLYYYVIGKVS